MQYTRNKDCLTAQVGGEMVMMNIDRGEYIGLTETAAEIWAMLEQPCDVDSVCAGLVALFEVDEAECRREVVRFLDQMVRLDAVSVIAPASG
jgi:Coenzyme PQQ synthesis protein D (PqqD)